MLQYRAFCLCKGVLCNSQQVPMFLFDHTKQEANKRRRRERTWNAMSKEDKEEYLRTTKDEGNKRLDFRFAH